MCDVKIGRLGKFEFNPRGELWRKDENRFGHKFLSKFGWSQGKGLGKNEDGIAENLKVRIKLGNTGVGWDEKLPIGIDYREYDAVLEDLSKRYQKSGEVKNEEISLEKRSQQFKNRIHYQKFVRGKDISRYSEKDMSCIFLSRESEKEEECPLKESTVTNIESSSSQLPAKECVPTFNSQMSIADYFAMKMKNKMGAGLNTTKDSKTLEESSNSETVIKSKKRKHKLKNKKSKRMKYETESNTIEGSLACEEDSSESSSSSQEATDDNSVSEDRAQNSEDLHNNGRMKKKKKTSKKMKKLLDTIRPKPSIANHDQEERGSVEDKPAENKGSEFDQSLQSCSNMPEDIVINEVKSKKRKKDQKSSKKAKKQCLGETEISSGVQKSSSSSETEETEKNSSEECVAINPKTEKQSRKESKKHKNKLSNLKSCLKSCLSNIKQSFKEKKNVSFSENVSFKLIESCKNKKDSDIVLETNEQLLSYSDEDCADSEVVNEVDNVENNLVNDFNLLVESTENDKQFSDKLENSDVSYDENPVNSDVAEDNTVPECFKLPKSSSTNYDSWLETQRIAARMKVYKNMAKKMKRHHVLKKTNLLDIKGYGNWGF